METKYPEVEFFIRNNLHEPDIHDAHSTIRQHVVALIANLASMCAGVAMGWTSPALPVLQQNETNSTLPLSITIEEGSWVSALVPLGAVFGALPAGFLANKFGRKRILLTLSAPYLFGWSLVIFSYDQLWVMLVGRFLLGLGVGASTVLVPLYCEEIAEVAIRGALGAYLDFMLCVGILWSYALGALLPYYWYTSSSCIVPLFFLFTFVQMPESPVYLVSKGQLQNAKKSLEWLRNGEKDYDVQPELDSIIASFKDAPDIKLKRSILIFCSWRPFRSTTARAVAIVLGLMLFQQLSGINAVIFYTVDIFKQAGSNMSAEMSTALVGIVQAIAVFCASATVDYLGRRFLLLLSTIVMALCLCMLSLYAYFTEDLRTDEIPSSVLWIPLFALILYTVVFALGFGPLPWLMMAELLPLRAKGWGSALSCSFNWKIALIVTKEFPVMLENLGQDVTYGILCICCILGTVFIAIFVPETKGKSRNEIQENLGGDKP